MHYNATFFQKYQFLEQVAVEIHSAITSLYKKSLFFSILYKYPKNRDKKFLKGVKISG